MRFQDSIDIVLATSFLQVPPSLPLSLPPVFYMYRINYFGTSESTFLEVVVIPSKV